MWNWSTFAYAFMCFVCFFCYYLSYTKIENSKSHQVVNGFNCISKALMFLCAMDESIFFWIFHFESINWCSSRVVKPALSAQLLMNFNENKQYINFNGVMISNSSNRQRIKKNPMKFYDWIKNAHKLMYAKSNMERF